MGTRETFPVDNMHGTAEFCNTTLTVIDIPEAPVSMKLGIRNEFSVRKIRSQY